MLPAHGKFAQCALGTVSLVSPAYGSVHVVLRPEQIELIDVGPTCSTHRPGTVPTVVGTVAYYGHDALVQLETHAGGAAILARLAGTPRPAAGSR